MPLPVRFNVELSVVNPCDTVNVFNPELLSIVKAPVMLGSDAVNCAPELKPEKITVSPPAAALASVMAWLNEPAPLGSVLLTVTVPA